MNTDHESWEGIPSVLPDWIYTADLDLFEARLAVKRRIANYFADVVGIDPSESEEAEILKMIRAARNAEDAAQQVKNELVIEARSRGVLLREIGEVLSMRESGVKNIVNRKEPTPQRKVEISRELRAWAALTHLWGRDVDTDEPGESFFRLGVHQLLLAQRRFDQAIRLRGRESDPLVIGRKMKLAYETLHGAFQGFTDPIIPRTIAKYAPARSVGESAPWATMPDAATASIRHGIFCVVLAVLTFTESLEEGGSADILLAGTYMATALISLSRPEAQFISDEMIEFLRREHPDLLPSTHLTADQLFRLHERQFGPDYLDDPDAS